MLYFDTSFLVPLILIEPTSVQVQRFFRRHANEGLVISEWTRVEFSSLLARDVRMGVLAQKMPAGPTPNLKNSWSRCSKCCCRLHGTSTSQNVICRIMGLACVHPTLAFGDRKQQSGRRNLYARQWSAESWQKTSSAGPALSHPLIL